MCHTQHFISSRLYLLYRLSLIRIYIERTRPKYHFSVKNLEIGLDSTIILFFGFIKFGIYANELCDLCSVYPYYLLDAFQFIPTILLTLCLDHTAEVEAEVRVGREALHEEKEVEVMTEEIMIKNSGVNQVVSRLQMTFFLFWSVICHKI